MTREEFLVAWALLTGIALTLALCIIFL